MTVRLRELSLLASTGWRMFREDPWWLSVQTARRFAPARRLALAPGRSRGLVAAVGAFLADEPARAAALLRQRGVTGRRLGDALAARLAVLVGAPDALAADIARRPEMAAAIAQQRGDLSGALKAYGQGRSAAARKLRSEWLTLQPGFRLPVPRVEPLAPVESSVPRALHLLTNSLPHTRSGYTNRTHHILSACRDAGVAIEAVTRIGYPTTVGLLGAADADVIDGITYRRLLTGRLARDTQERLYQQVEALLPIARAFRPTVLHTTTDFTNALITQALASALDLPWVYEMRGQLELTWVASRPKAYRDAAESSERVRLLRAKEAELAAAADAVVVLSRVQAQDLVDRGVPPTSIVVMPNAIDPTLLERDADPGDVRERLGLPREGLWVGTVSSLVAYEGIDDLLRAVALLRAEGLDVRALVVGDGVARPEWVALADELGLAEAALFPGRVTAREAPDWYQALDVFAVPRKDTPVCRVVTPLKPVEAMALGRPVVASHLPALREILADGQAGDLFLPDDPGSLADVIRRLAEHETALRTLGQEGRAAVRTRTWGAGAARLIQKYRELRR